MPSQLFWMSWWQPGDDYRPVAWPPPEAVLAYWCTGYRGGDGTDEAAVVALVRAEDADAAWAAIRTEGAWADAGEERFCEPRDGSQPPGDRFPTPKWSVEMGRWPWPAKS